jgi:hypothetical protein
MIVTRDFNNFQPNVITILRRQLGIRVFSAADMLAELDLSAEGISSEEDV